MHKDASMQDEAPEASTLMHKPVQIVSFWGHFGVTLVGLIALCGLGWLLLAGLRVL